MSLSLRVLANVGTGASVTGFCVPGSTSTLAAFAVALLVALSVGFATPALAQRTINQVIAATPTDEPVHLVFVHGIRVDTRGASLPLQMAMCKHIDGGCPPSVRVSTDVLDLGRNPMLNFAGQPVWKSDKEWEASRPIVDHYVYRLPIGKTLIVDEVNWWPFAFPLKCRVVVAPDAELIGFNARTVQLCANLKPNGQGGYEPAFDDHFAWIDREKFFKLKDERPPYHGAPALNRYVKAEIFDWGLVEAVLALGTTKIELRETIRCAMTAVAGFDPSRGVDVTPTRTSPLAPPEVSGATTIPCKDEGSLPWRAAGSFVIVSHSLGSFLLLDTFAAATGDIRDLEEQLGRTSTPATAVQPSGAAVTLCEPPDKATFAAAAALSSRALPSSPAASAASKEAAERVGYQGLCFVVKHSDMIYFLANQIPLLELGRIEAGTNADGSPRDTLGEWAKLASQSHGAETTQIIAFNEPGDALTFPAPGIQGASVPNVAVHNAIHWFNLVEDPNAAHLGYFSNSEVLRAMFGH